MGRAYLLHNCVEFLFLRLVNGVVLINTEHRAVGRNHDNVHLVDISELLLLRLSRTGHAGLLSEFIEEVLEGDGSQRAALSLNLHMLLRLDGLVQSVRIAAARHNTSRKLVDNENFVVLYHIVLVAEHQIVGPQSHDHVVLDLQVLRICQVLDIEILLYLLNAL